MTGTLFLKEKQCAILIALKDNTQQWYASKLAAHTKSTYVFVHYFVNQLHAQGIVKFEQRGKLRLVSLTEKGVIIASNIEELARKINEAVAAASAASAAAAQKNMTGEAQMPGEGEQKPAQKTERDLGVV